jgi:hypothetical protein
MTKKEALEKYINGTISINDNGIGWGYIGTVHSIDDNDIYLVDAAEYDGYYYGHAIALEAPAKIPSYISKGNMWIPLSKVQDFEGETELELAQHKLAKKLEDAKEKRRILNRTRRRKKAPWYKKPFIW